MGAKGGGPHLGPQGVEVGLPRSLPLPTVEGGWLDGSESGPPPWAACQCWDLTPSSHRRPPR